MRIAPLGPGDEHVVLAGADLFDRPPTEPWTSKFLSSEGHNLLVALDDEEKPIGFVSGVETTHPDKGTEMFLYELSVHAHHRKQGIGKALVEALADLARRKGCLWHVGCNGTRQRGPTCHVSRRCGDASRAVRDPQLDIRERPAGLPARLGRRHALMTKSDGLGQPGLTDRKSSTYIGIVYYTQG